MQSHGRRRGLTSKTEIFLYVYNSGRLERRSRGRERTYCSGKEEKKNNKNRILRFSRECWRGERMEEIYLSKIKKAKNGGRPARALSVTRRWKEPVILTRLIIIHVASARNKVDPSTPCAGGAVETCFFPFQSHLLLLLLFLLFLVSIARYRQLLQKPPQKRRRRRHLAACCCRVVTAAADFQLRGRARLYNIKGDHPRSHTCEPRGGRGEGERVRGMAVESTVGDEARRVRNFLVRPSINHATD